MIRMFSFLFKRFVLQKNVLTYDEYPHTSHFTRRFRMEYLYTYIMITRALPADANTFTNGTQLLLVVE